MCKENEYLKYRCCMCPNGYHNHESTICPKGPFKTNETLCRFVKTYIDNRGWKYKVMPGIGESNYKARYQDDKHTGDIGWKCMRQLEWRKTFDEAQADLNALAKKKGWDVFK